MKEQAIHSCSGNERKSMNGGEKKDL